MSNSMQFKVFVFNKKLRKLSESFVIILCELVLSGLSLGNSLVTQVIQ